MRVTFVGHACLLIESSGVTVLSDPWWRGPCFGAQWWIYPTPYLQALEGKVIDYVYLSHGHHDHFHPGTLSTFSRNTKVLLSAATGLASAVRELGFEVVELNGEQEFPLGPPGTSCRVMETHGGDTLFAMSDPHEVCVNLNDSLHAAPDEIQNRFIDRLNGLFPVIDYVFCGYGVASHFPNCYIIPGKDRERTAMRRQMYFNRRWAQIISKLKPRFAFPFAADVIFLEDDLFWVNRPTHNSERPTETLQTLFPGSGITTHDIAPGFVIEGGQVLQLMKRSALSEEEIRSSCADGIERANRHGRADEATIREICALLQKSVGLSSGYLRSYDADYRFMIRFPKGERGICVEKKKTAISVTMAHDVDESSYDIVYTTRPAYLKRSLSAPYGNEILFVGSGGLMQYRKCPMPGEHLNRELMYMLRNRDHPSPPRYGRWPTTLARIKRTVRQLVKRETPDLYDVAEWTVFNNEGGASR